MFAKVPTAPRNLADEREHDGLGVEEPPGDRHIALHVLGIDEQPVDQAVEPREHIVDQDGAVRDDDPLDRGMADVPFVPQGDVLHGRVGIRPNNAGETREVLRGYGIPLVRHG